MFLHVFLGPPAKKKKMIEKKNPSPRKILPLPEGKRPLTGMCTFLLVIRSFFILYVTIFPLGVLYPEHSQLAFES